MVLIQLKLILKHSKNLVLKFKIFESILWFKRLMIYSKNKTFNVEFRISISTFDFLFDPQFSFLYWKFRVQYRILSSACTYTFTATLKIPFQILEFQCRRWNFHFYTENQCYLSNFSIYSQASADTHILTFTRYLTLKFFVSILKFWYLILNLSIFLYKGSVHSLNHSLTYISIRKCI